jgi:hypothetical protein
VGGNYGRVTILAEGTYRKGDGTVKSENLVSKQNLGTEIEDITDITVLSLLD